MTYKLNHMPAELVEIVDSYVDKRINHALFGKFRPIDILEDVYNLSNFDIIKPDTFLLNTKSYERTTAWNHFFMFENITQKSIDIVSNLINKIKEKNTEEKIKYITICLYGMIHNMNTIINEDVLFINQSKQCNYKPYITEYCKILNKLKKLKKSFQNEL